MRSAKALLAAVTALGTLMFVGSAPAWLAAPGHHGAVGAAMGDDEWGGEPSGDEGSSVDMGEGEEGEESEAAYDDGSRDGRSDGDDRGDREPSYGE